MENDKERDESTAGWERKHVSRDNLDLFNQRIGDVMVMMNVMGNLGSIALVVWDIVSKKEVPHHMITVEDGDELEWHPQKEGRHVFDEKHSTAMDNIGSLLE
ncbi:predicted protein [Lichtheimia corymbifera JMRC:FSU:9682]|uniref:Uncharacterized protein n=1 Tax=Lichtheimia corymbifera JMRC:FSU:9682 TaxID=1263082 RepID=A0A068RHZ3_9FUNG|nr:predicted protein [Lichtheimia corymbifera JMRC:FSU:9682]